VKGPFPAASCSSFFRGSRYAAPHETTLIPYQNQGGSYFTQNTKRTGHFDDFQERLLPWSKKPPYF
jgi:hypothetical protein